MCSGALDACFGWNLSELDASQIHDTKNLMVLKMFATETPLNSAAIAPNRPYVCFYSFVHSTRFDPLKGPSRWWSRRNERNNDVSQAG